MQRSLFAYSAILCAPLASLHAADAAQQAKPNIIIVATD
jgi:hypothetical protein